MQKMKQTSDVQLVHVCNKNVSFEHATLDQFSHGELRNVEGSPSALGIRAEAGRLAQDTVDHLQGLRDSGTKQ
jgi:hypothetical protein